MYLVCDGFNTKLRYINKLIGVNTVQLFSLTEAGVVSSCRAPWLETCIAATPRFAAIFASSAVKMPFSTIGNLVILPTHKRNGTELQ